MAATLANAVVKQVILRLLERGLDTAALAVTSGQLDPIVRRLSNIVPAIVIWRGIKLVPHLPAGVIDVTQNVVSAFIALTIRSEERRCGKEWVMSCRSRRARRCHNKKKKISTEQT